MLTINYLKCNGRQTRFFTLQWLICRVLSNLQNDNKMFRWRTRISEDVICWTKLYVFVLSGHCARQIFMIMNCFLCYPLLVMYQNVHKWLMMHCTTEWFEIHIHSPVAQERIPCTFLQDQWLIPAKLNYWHTIYIDTFVHCVPILLVWSCKENINSWDWFSIWFLWMLNDSINF